jgi:hypothetical protein
MISQFANLEFKAYDNEVLIGFTPANEALLGFLTPFLFNPTWLKGDGSQDLKAEFSVSLGHSFSEALGDEPAYSNFLKGIQLDASTKLYEGSRDILVKTINDNWGVFEPLFTKFPFLSTIFLYAKAGGLLEFDCDEELKE